MYRLFIYILYIIYISYEWSYSSSYIHLYVETKYLNLHQFIMNQLVM